jgi:hypothetical protein
LAAWLWFFTLTMAICSSVVPWRAMWAWAASAKHGGAVRPWAASHSRSTPVPMLRRASSAVGTFNFSTPRTMTRSARPAAMKAYAYRSPTVPEAHMCSVRAESRLGLMPRASAAIDEMWL